MRVPAEGTVPRVKLAEFAAVAEHPVAASAIVFHAFMAALLMSTTACSNRDATERRGSDAIVVSAGSTGVWGQNSRWRAETDVRFGLTMGTDSVRSGTVVAFTVDKLGRIYVLDQADQRVHVFSASGEHVRTFGRRGAGPGEFQDATGFAWESDETLWVVDPGNGRYTVFDTAGNLVGTKPRRSSGYIVPWPGRFDSTGALYDVAIWPDSSPNGFGNVLIRVTSSSMDSLPLPTYEPNLFSVPDRPGMRGWVPFSARLVWQVDLQGTLWHAVTDQYRIHRVAFTGDTLRVVERDVPALPVSNEEKQRMVAELEALGVDIAQVHMPSLKPSMETFTVDADGFLWVYSPNLTATSPSRFDVFSPSGHFLGQVPADVRFQASPAPLIVADRIYGLVEMSPGNQSMVSGRIIGR